MPGLQLNRILRLIKENKKKFYGNIWRNYSNIDLLQSEDMNIVVDKMPRWLWDNYSNKSYARELKVIYLAVDHLIRFNIGGIGNRGNGWYAYFENRSSIAKACEVLHKKYWRRFHKIYGKRARLRGGWPQMKKTQALKEFLAMGWIYLGELPFNPHAMKEGQYVCKCHIADLWYPEIFDQHIKAINMPFHIPGYSGSVIPK